MKRIVSIFFLSAALLVLTALSLVPHHHHRTVMCTVTEFCETDHTVNDRHTGHDMSGAEAEDEGCIAHASFAPANVLASVASPDALLLSVLEQAVSSALSAPEQSGLQTEYELYIIAYRSASPNPGGGLRAPPSLS